MYVAVIDIDGTILNCDVRYGLARGGDGRKGINDENIDKAIAHHPDHLVLDRLIEGADVAVRSLILQGYDVIYLTSRPESLREATVAWLAQHAIGYSSLIMKAPGSPKTPLWKAMMVLRIANEAENVLFVDDDEENRKAVAALNLANVTIKESLLKSEVRTMDNFDELEDLEELYGPLYKFSDHKVNEVVSFTQQGTTKQGTIIWVRASGPVVEGGKDHPVIYIVDVQGESWVSEVYPGEIVEAKDQP